LAWIAWGASGGLLRFKVRISGVWLPQHHLDRSSARVQAQFGRNGVKLGNPQFSAGIDADSWASGQSKMLPAFVITL